MLIQIPYLLVLQDTPLVDGYAHLLNKFSGGVVTDYGAYSTCLGVRDSSNADFEVMTFKIEALLGVWRFLVNICDTLAILIFMRMPKNGCTIKLCSTVNLILGCMFWSKSYESLVLPCKHFQNIKQSSRYLFYILIKSFLTLFSLL